MPLRKTMTMLGAGAAMLLLPAVSAAGGPANDNFPAGSAPESDITTLPALIDGSNADATGQMGEPDHENTAVDVHSVWYRWVATATERIRLDTCLGYGFATRVSVYESSATPATLASLTVPPSSFSVWSDGPCAHTFLADERYFDAVTGQTYWIAVDSGGPFTDGLGSYPATGAFKLLIEGTNHRYLPTPTITRADPPSGSWSPRIFGTAAPGTTVSLYTDPACSGASVGDTGSAEQFASGGLEQSVGPGQTKVFYAQANDQNRHYSLCSAGFSYTGEPADGGGDAKAPAKKKKKKKKKKKTRK
jgi:hypothetical protein